MPVVICPVHGVDLCEMSFERTPRTQNDSRKGLDILGHGSYWKTETEVNPISQMQQRDDCHDLRLVSAVKSFFCRIFSFSWSASRRAAEIFSCISA